MSISDKPIVKILMLKGEKGDNGGISQDQFYNLQSQVNGLASGSPLAASSVGEMTDTTRIYVNTTDGYWYYYDGTEWQQGGVYLSSNNGDRIDDLIDITLSFTDGYYINGLGNLASNNSYKYSDYIKVHNKGISIPIKIRTQVTKTCYAAAYDENYNLIEAIKLSNSDDLEEVITTIYKPSYRYIRFSCRKTYSDYYAYYSNLINMSVSGIKDEMIQDNGISYNKTNYIVPDDYRNLINRPDITLNNYITSTGALHSDPSLHASDYFRVEHANTYYYGNIRLEYYAYYDENKAFISGYSTLGNLSGGTFTPPEGAKYMRVSIHNSNLGKCYVSLSADPLKYQLVDNVIPNTYCDYTGDEIVAFNKILCIGDSLTYGVFNTSTTPSSASFPNKYSYPKYLSKLTGSEVTNKGHGGLNIEEWYQAHGNDDLTGHDLCIIALGTNDHSWTSTQITAMTNIINKVKADNNNIKIFVSSIIPARSYQADYYDDINEGLQALVTSLADPDVMYIDLTTYGHTNDSLCYNAGHLTAYGYYRLAQDYHNYISFIMMTNPTKFRFIQFIGTNLYYNN